MTTSPASEQDRFLSEARSLVRDLMTPHPWIYWCDFLFHITLGWAAFAAALYFDALSGRQILAGLVAVLAFYRGVIFIHELAHLKKGTFGLFRLSWNLLCGIPLLVPSFTYDGVHNEHHKRDVYGTPLDGEYLPFAAHKPFFMVGYVLLSFLLPWFMLIRFLLLTPLSWLVPLLRKPVWERASSLSIDPTYRRPANAIRHDRLWRLQEFAAFLFAAFIVTAIVLNWLSIEVVVLWYLVIFSIFVLNSLRTLAAHAYRNGPGQSVSVVGQFLDSVNVPGNRFITPLWAPVGLRLHATHHLFPAMPYHNLGAAHSRLINGLSDNSLYLETLRHSLWDALRRLWHEASQHRRQAEMTGSGNTGCQRTTP